MLFACSAICLLAMGVMGAAVAEDMEAIKIELPEPFFGGTPLDYWGPNLEPYDFKEREPFMAPKGTELISKDKPVTSSDTAPLVGELKQFTDGDKDYAKKSLIELKEGVQWVQIDLEKEATLYAICLWHFHEGKRVYFDIVAQASNDPNFKDGVTTLYNNDMDNSAGLGAGKDKEYIESEKGRLIDAKGTKARYVRFYSNGSTANGLNNYVESDVFGKF
ncbi:MAG: hypothetical protein HYV27_23835 [Candidatus Hydrogenedentes bacterium]|nr:hypothetical protein [Candidatus Hydrogenedentota bacterium]